MTVKNPYHHSTISHRQGQNFYNKEIEKENSVLPHRVSSNPNIPAVIIKDRQPFFCVTYTEYSFSSIR